MMSFCDQQASGADREAIIDQAQKASYPEGVPERLNSLSPNPQI